MRYVPRITSLGGRSYKAEYLLSKGRLFGLEESGGGLRPAYGLSQITVNNIPAAAQGIYFTSHNNLYIYNGGTVYRCTGASNNFYLYASGFTARPSFAECHENGEDFTIICDGGKAVKAQSNTAGPDTCPPVRYAVVHYNRMFGIDTDDARTIRWSEPGDVHGWDAGINGAGYVRLDALRGDISKLTVFDNKLVAVRQYGLTVLRAFGEAESFRVDVTDTVTDGITADTVAVCAGKLCFFTPSGMYCYDGTVKKFEAEGLEGFGDVSCAAACGGYYYAGGKLGGEDVIACIDVNGRSAGYIKAKAVCMCGGGRVFFYGDGLYEIVRTAEQGSWESGPCDFGTPSKKFLCSITAYGADTLTVECGGRSRTYSGVNGEVKVGMEGREFSISASCSQHLRSVCAKYAVRG